MALVFNSGNSPRGDQFLGHQSPATSHVCPNELSPAGCYFWPVKHVKLRESGDQFPRPWIEMKSWRVMGVEMCKRSERRVLFYSHSPMIYTIQVPFQRLSLHTEEVDDSCLDDGGKEDGEC